MKQLTNKGGFQGDVAIVPVDGFPKDAKPTKNRKVALGEVTGHSHQILGDVDMRETSDAFYFQVLGNSQVVISHEPHPDTEHETIEILPNQVWRVAKVAQVEYDGEQERAARD